MKILITGISGFVAHHFMELLAEQSGKTEILGLYNHNVPAFTSEHFPSIKLNLLKADLLDRANTEEIVQKFEPEYILHLASRSSVGESWIYPAECMSENTLICINLLEAVRKHKIPTRILSVGSVEEYGRHNLGPGEKINETYTCDPVNPYGAAKYMQGKVSRFYAENFGVDITHTRSFNHFGRYQKPTFVIASFASQVAQQIREGKKEINLTVGNVDVVRDFTNVKDIVRAYYDLLLTGKKGEIYNVCSGKGTRLKDILHQLQEISGTPIYYETNPALIRPEEIALQVGDNTKILKETGWMPKITILQSLEDLFESFLKS